MNRHDLLNLISRAAVMLQQRGAAGNQAGRDLLTEMSAALLEDRFLTAPIDQAGYIDFGALKRNP